MKLINIADMINPETGKTYREENNEKGHNIPLGTLVEVVFDDSGYKTTSDVISEITEVLGEWDGKTLEQIANQILSTPVKYIGDSLFKQE